MSALISKQYLVASKARILRELLDVNAIFCLAIFIATALLSTQSGSDGVYTAEILILLHIFFWNTYIISYEQLLMGNHGRELTAIGVTSTIVITVGMSCFAVYYWFYAVEILPAANCGAFGFLFAKLSLDGGARTFFKIVAVINMVVWGISFLLLVGYAVPYLLLGLVRMLYYSTRHGILVSLKRVLSSNAEVQASWRNTNKGHTRYVIGLYMGVFAAPRGEVELQGWPQVASKSVFAAGVPQENPIMYAELFSHDQTLTTGRHVWKYISLCIMIFSILAIELIIQWNSISGVYTIRSTGQVIPFIIGIGGLSKVLFTAFVQVFDGDSVWSAKNEAFRLHNGKWVKFPIKTPARRRSWAGELIE